MDLKDMLHDYLQSMNQENKFEELSYFLSLCDEKEYDPALTKYFLANIDFKHKFAKYIVNRIVLQNVYFHDKILDARLDSLIQYQVCTKLFNSDLRETSSAHLIRSFVKLYFWDSVKQKNFESVMLESENVPVKMQPGGVWRLFTVNLLGFVASKFIMGIRVCWNESSKPVNWMKYHKGCSPAGVRRDSKGQEWTLFKIDASLTDDFTAQFSNGLEKDGIIEICDWVSDSDVRVIFRTEI